MRENLTNNEDPIKTDIDELEKQLVEHEKLNYQLTTLLNISEEGEPQPQKGQSKVTIDYGLPGACFWRAFSYFPSIRNQAPLATLHRTWIIFDSSMTLIVLMTSLLYGDYHSGIRHLPKMMGGLDNFLTVLVIHCSWVGLTSCMSSGNGKKPYDFLITRCLRHPIFALLHGALMFLMGYPWYYGI